MTAFPFAILNSCPITGRVAILNYCPIRRLLSICHLEFLTNQRQAAPLIPPRGIELSLLHYFGTYECTFESGKKMPLSQFAFIIAKLEAQCYETEWLYWCIGAEICTYTLITLFCILYRRRHDIRYFFLKLKLNRQKLMKFYDRKRYLFSAFVSCDHRDAKYFVYRILLQNLETEET